ncbi:hypothetical protein FOZ60_005514 [Perkinsus olseni]|uniref:MULE transposase domain-containing protein n=1 Tax=Perkinsus olseni TaxID=32597 RepID=A0A7J6PGH3_PEROL|nr:hypothetical protein FOZ60_005514 [Perkinsus olseni]
MRTRTSTGTPIKLPSRYQQPGTDDKGKPVPKAKAKRRARPKPKARCLPNTKRVRSTSSRSDPKGNSSANPTLNVDMEAFPYGPLSGLGLNSPPETRMYPSEESNGGLSTRPLPADIEDPIDDKFSDDSHARSGGTEIVVLPPIPSSSSRQPPQNTNKIDQNPMICNDTNEGFSGRRCGEMVVMDGSDQDEILKYLSSLTEEELERLLDPEMLPMDASRGRPTRGESGSSTAEAACQDAGEVEAGPESASHHYCIPRNIAHQILHDIARLLSQGRIPTNEVNELLLPPAGQDHAAADEDDGSAESVGEGEPGAVKRGRGDAIAWKREKVFDNEDDADAWLETHSYGLQRSNYTKKYGFKRYYYCRDCGKPGNHREESTTSVMAGGNPVGHQIYLHYETTSSRVVMFSNDGTHVHDEDAKKRGLAEEVKEFIERKVGEGVVDLPTIWDKILRRINKGKIQQENRPKDKRQVKNYLARVKKATNGGSMAITMSDLISMTEEHSQLPGDQEPDKAFVVHRRFVDGSFQAIFSTRRCVEASRKAVMMSTDATYKGNFHGCPVLTLAMVDYHNHIFPIALAICGNEKIDDYRELFLSMDVGAAKMGLPSHSPRFIMADGAPAITRAAGQVFPAAGRAMCWYHMKKNVETFMRGLKMEERDENTIMRDLSYVQLATSQKAFFEMFRLFAAQHEPRHPELLKYIRESWVQNPPYNTWWEGFAPGYYPLIMGWNP